MSRHKKENEMSATSLYLKDLAERTLFTGAEAAVGVFVADQAVGAVPGEAWWVVPVAMLAAALKGVLAKKVGRSESASTVPSV
jgi:hypothetical protein